MNLGAEAKGCWVNLDGDTHLENTPANANTAFHLRLHCALPAIRKHIAFSMIDCAPTALTADQVLVYWRSQCRKHTTNSFSKTGSNAKAATSPSCLVPMFRNHPHTHAPTRAHTAVTNAQAHTHNDTKAPKAHLPKHRHKDTQTHTHSPRSTLTNAKRNTSTHTHANTPIPTHENHQKHTNTHTHDPQSTLSKAQAQARASPHTRPKKHTSTHTPQGEHHNTHTHTHSQKSSTMERMICQWFPKNSVGSRKNNVPCAFEHPEIRPRLFGWYRLLTKTRKVWKGIPLCEDQYRKQSVGILLCKDGHPYDISTK